MRQKLKDIWDNIKDILILYMEKPEPIIPVTQPPIMQNPDALLDWNTIEGAHHNVRAVCDLEGLNWNQKQILTACVKQESGFLVNPKPNTNKDKNGQVWSTDYGIVQINDYFHIGHGKDFLSVQYVLDNPETCVRWMCRYYKAHGHLNAWASFTSGAYKKYLGKV